MQQTAANPRKAYDFKERFLEFEEDFFLAGFLEWLFEPLIDEPLCKRGDFFWERDRWLRSILDRSTVSNSLAIQANSQAFFFVYFLNEKLIFLREPSFVFQDAQ